VCALMLDPSLVLSTRTTSDVHESVMTQSEPIFLPGTFFELVQEQQFGHRAFKFFRPGPAQPTEAYADHEESLARATSWILEEPRIGPWRAAPFFEAEHIELRVRDEVIRSILEEEWAFLQGQSWLASRIRRPFRKFIDGGAAAVEFGREAFDLLARRTLKIPAVEDVPPALTPEKRLRAVAKWAAVGVPGVASSIFPVLTPIAPAVAGYFLLFDP
jgi:hypothetical protein